MRVYRLNGASPGASASSSFSIPAPAPSAEPSPAPPARTGGAPFAAGLPSAIVPAPAQAEEPRAARAGRQYPPTTDARPLTPREVRPLAMLAAAAFRKHAADDPAFLPELKARGVSRAEAERVWRHGQCRLATRGHEAGEISGLTRATRAHYRTLEAHFAALAGMDLRSFDATMRTGRQPGRAGAAGDRREDVEQARAVLARTMAATKTHPNYVAAIIKSKHGATSTDQLGCRQLWNLIFTLRNRASARDGKGDPRNRNKSQTAARRAARDRGRGA